MVDESFKYTLHHIDGSKEVKIGNLKDVHTFLTDKIELEVYRLHRRIDYMNRLNIGAVFVLGCFMIGVAISVFVFLR